MPRSGNSPSFRGLIRGTKTHSDLAQTAELRTRNAVVIGSTPIVGSSYIPAWRKRQRNSLVRNRFGISIIPAGSISRAWYIECALGFQPREEILIISVRSKLYCFYWLGSVLSLQCLTLIRKSKISTKFSGLVNVVSSGLTTTGHALNAGQWNGLKSITLIQRRKLVIEFGIGAKRSVMRNWLSAKSFVLLATRKRPPSKGLGKLHTGPLADIAAGADVKRVVDTKKFGWPPITRRIQEESGRDRLIRCRIASPVKPV